MAIKRDDVSPMREARAGLFLPTIAAPRRLQPAGLLVLVLLLFAVAGCSSIPRGMLAPVAVPAGTSRIDMLAVTTRSLSTEPGEMFNGDRGESVSLSRIVVSIPPDREVGTIQWPQTLPGNPATDFVVASAEPMKREQVGAWFKSRSGKARRAFIYIHGFNTPFDRAVIRFAQLVQDTDADAAPILFSWPSRGKLLDYKRDFDNATYSRNDLAELLKIAASSPNVSEIVLLAHSMGSWVAVEAVKQFAQTNGHVPAKFRNLILASPDLDVGIFRRQVEAMGRQRPEITIFVSQEDRALQLSRFIARAGTRLGAINAQADDYKSQFKNIQKVTVVDVTALRSGDGVNHSIYASSPKVVQLIGSRLISGELDTDAEASGVFSIGDRIGSAARLIVASPTLVLDAATPW